MINIVISNNDSFSRKGMASLLQKIFAEQFDEAVSFSFELTRQDIETADVIIADLQQGEQHLCRHDFLARKSGIIIGLVDFDCDKARKLPSCFADMVFINKRTPLNNIEDCISRMWRERPTAQEVSCLGCSRKKLSLQQSIIMREIYQGKSTSEIAVALQLNPKTIFAHKYGVMNKFNLCSNFELYHFLNQLGTHSIE